MDPPELATIQDTLEDALHDQLDALVNEDPIVLVMTPGSITPEQFQEFFAIILLNTIIKHSGDRLNKENLRSHGNLLIEKKPALLEKLQEAWKIKKYRSIRLLKILQASTRFCRYDQRQPLAISFRAPFFGAAVDGFLEYLETNERLFRDQSVEAPYYAKFCSIVQSSGTGKSRMLTELSKRNVVVLYISLRDEKDETGFPLRDPIPCGILQSNGTANEYKNVCYAFMTVLFETLEEYLSDAVATQGAKNAVEYWSKTMCNMDLSNTEVREQFFGTLRAKYNLYAPLLIARSSDPSNNSDVEEAAGELRTLSLSESQKEHAGSVSLSVRRTVLLEAYKKLGACLEKIINGASTRPRLVIAIDEAHPLSKPGAFQYSKYHPADILTRVINVYSHSEAQHAIWVVFASTTSRVADFSPPNPQHNSLRSAVRGYQLFRPYTQLGWDQHAPALGELDANDIAKFSHILTYGRPLWKSLVASVYDPEGLFFIAKIKLRGGKHLNSGDVGPLLAAFGQRFALEVTLGHPDSLQVLQTAITSHLRICLSMTLDRSWCYTSYPSEPLLSCAAAAMLHSTDLHRALMMLEDGIRQGMINIGERGGLTSRLLWLIAKDLYVRKHFDHTPEGFVVNRLDLWQSELLDCKMIPVVGWLEFVFGERVFGESDVDRQRARACFADAYVNFSHWISMDSNLSGASDDLPLELWTLRHWQRTSAVQCAPHQPLVDKVIPIYFKGTNKPVAAPDQMSQIFISDEDRGSSSNSHLNDITRQHPSIGGDDMMDEDEERTRDGQPYIAIVADLGLSPAFSATFPPPGVADLCLRIYAAGLDTTTYPFLAEYPNILSRLKEFVLLHKIPEDDLWYGKQLDAQMRFGTTATAEHMDWQRDMTAPTQPTE